MNKFMEPMLVWVIFWFLSGIVGMFTWPYAINSWLLFAGKEATCTMLNGFLLGMVPVLGRWGLPVAVVTWLAMLFL